MQKTTFNIPKMDCASEEQMIRMKLEGIDNIQSLDFDIPNRKLEIYHSGAADNIYTALDSLRLGTKMINTETIENTPIADDHQQERKLLWQVLGINFFFFLFEMVTGFIADSMGLVADSLDMLADSIVYGLSLFAVGATVAHKKSIAKASGYLQATLAILGFVEVIRRFLGFGDVPTFQIMIIISLLALTGNALSLYLLQKSKSKEAHMQASVIFTSNDVIINIGVIIAGALVYLTASKLPDLIVGSIVFIIVARGAFKILQLSK